MAIATRSPGPARLRWFALVTILAGCSESAVEGFSSTGYRRRRRLGSVASVAPPRFPSQRAGSALCLAKRNKKSGSDDMNNWYDSVDEGATPDDVFWDEMERQRLVNQIGSGVPDAVGSIGSSSRQVAMATNPSPNQGRGASAFPNPGASTPPDGMPSFGSGGGRNAESSSRKPPTLEQQKSADATLSEYSLFQVSDNWLDEGLQAYFAEQLEGAGDEEEELSVEEQTRILMEKLESLPDGAGPGSDLGALIDQDEPWEYFGEDDSTQDLDRVNTLKVPHPSEDSEFFLGDDPPTEDERAEDAAALKERLKGCGIRSARLEKARASPKAKAFFERVPNAKEGYDRMWALAVEPAVVKIVAGNLRDYGVEFADNFGDWTDSSAKDGLFSIEDVTAMKARAVYEATGLPCIASRTSFEVEPVPQDTAAPIREGADPALANVGNPRVLSGYKINDVAKHADYLCEALRPVSEPTRVTRFTSCLCYYDGELEILEHGVCDCDLHYAYSMRTLVSMGQAVTAMVDTLKMTLFLEYQSSMSKRIDDAATANASRGGAGAAPGSAARKLRDRVLKEGRVLPNDIIDVSRFMDSMVDVNLMDDCAEELANMFLKEKPTKIITVATTGLVVALPMAKYLQVPVVYARKERNVVMADTYSAAFASKTVGKNRELLVSKSHISEDDRILVVDDFLSSGASQEALLRIISDAGATAVGVGVLLEKAYESGRMSLSGFGIPVRSLCRVASVAEGSIQLLEEDGFDLPTD